MFPFRSVVGKPDLADAFEAGLAVLADLLPAAGVFVLGRHTADAGGEA